MEAIRVYIHEGGEWLTLCPNDEQGDVLFKMPEGWGDKERAVIAIREVQRLVREDANNA